MASFRILKAFNDEGLRAYAGVKTRIGRNCLEHFSGDSLADRIVRELAHERALPVKEVVEAFEFFAVARKYLRRVDAVVDLCSGHGLAGILFGVFERRVGRVVLCDRRRPDHFEHVLRATTKVAPWLAEKVEYREGTLAKLRDGLPAGSAVLGVHACGRLTDDCLEIGAGLGGPVAVLPCCRAHAQNSAPAGLRAALGEDVAYDVHRTYAMEARGYSVRWREIPLEITPMNRVLIAVPRGRAVGAESETEPVSSATILGAE